MKFLIPYTRIIKNNILFCVLYVTDTCPYKTEIIKELKYKLSSYMGQDKKHGFYDKAKCLDIQGIIELLVSSKLKCNYCKGSVFLLYKEIRQGNQWTLDRIDNTQGHNVGNCEIACYTCNVQKKQMDDKIQIYKANEDYKERLNTLKSIILYFIKSIKLLYKNINLC